MQDNDSYIYRRGTTPNTRLAISQKNKVYSIPNGKNVFSQVGVLSSFAISESRNVTETRGIGYGDQLAELIPDNTGAMSLTINRTLMYLSNLYQTFGYAGGVDGLVRSLKHHQWPFDIKQELVFSRIATNEAVSPKNVAPSSDGVNQALLTFYEACWMTSYGASFSADSSIIAEDTTAMVSDVVDGISTYGELAADALSTGNNPFTSGGSSIRYSNRGAGNPTFG